MNDFISKHPNASKEELFTAGWMACTEAWCHGKREKMEKVCELMSDIIR